MSGWLFLRNFNKQKINNISQRNYINSLVVLTIKIAKATDRTVFAHQANIINTDLFCVIKKIDVLTLGNDSNLLIVFYVQIMPDDFVMQLHR
ncbi:hypothetical protein, partial [Escherichia coli]|uniref:hypothetical protein n=1 Tax=Escherichia coli TaxID=562 RepID=UPI002078B99A